MDLVLVWESSHSFLRNTTWGGFEVNESLTVAAAGASGK